MPTDKQIAKATKEGGKKGQDLAGLADMGGVKFFCIALDEPAGDKELLFAALAGANAEVDPEAGELKGGAKELGKVLLSYGEDKLSMLCHLPASLADKLSADEWMKTLMDKVGGEILETKDEEGKIIYAEAKADKDNGKFPIKMRDEASAASYDLLKTKGFVGGDDDSDFDLNQCEDMQDLEW
ncbi:unnamed protein product [Pedinophyceae sp. YPF-701]|nr:unnamed protein product [Pedinophyceae sp. YPF-701]